MVRRAVLISIAVVALFAFLVPGASLAAVSQEEVEATPSKEAWHYENAACVSFVDCSALPPANPYPEDTLHVAASSGQETARTYLAFEPLLPLDAVLKEGNLVLPVDADPDSGSVTPEEASMVACLTEPTFKPTKGSVEKPPEVDCEIRKAALYSAKKRTFEVDLSPFVEEWDPDGRMALALLPSDKAKTNNETWHVVFPATTEDDPDEVPEEEEEAEPRVITATFTFMTSGTSAGPIGTEFEFDTTTGPDSSSTGGFDSASGASSFGSSTGTGTIDTGTGGTGAIDSGTAATDAGAAPTEALSPEASQQVLAFAEGFAGPGFAYPIVWAAPLVMLIGFAAIGRALTKELYRAGD